ncbi:dolichyl-phosphate beta-glucosyltransferase [Fistulifera solaris]|jgi:dolichyl-phosphate beta-glucosyltransferase|uniref:dolichyl-phosphate beta-glucosyltransferase n=1 Tax=Fistulifera solaris TaxID=1519565 RepID=A0A1Z5JPL3_FISSO|nr:dolichyl-phosphate beta-glucosyltransferase [Fistulifera solaris]|eukprot:GAX15944.1 dolichyl-phosphate beta-glucosyltransferase [Fistulifera solaris]
MIADDDFSSLWAVGLLGLLLMGVLCYLFYPAYVAREGRGRVLPQATIIGNSSTEEDVLLSIIIPAFNEELRLPIMLEDAFHYLSSPSSPALKQLGNGTVEWIVVDDGSSDQTGQAFRRYVEQKPPTPNMCYKLIALPCNLGKGAAVQSGMLAATGQYCLYVDADGATSFGPGLEALTRHIVSGKEFVFMGSRAHLQQERSFLRRFLALAFRILLTITLGPAAQHIRDTQCGFKLLSRNAAQRIFRTLHLQRWAFDIEVLYLAVHLQVMVKEEIVPWHEVEGSKLNTSIWNLALVSSSMLRDMICVRLCYQLGIWSFDNDVKKQR